MSAPLAGVASTGRFSEFMIRGSLVEPEDSAETAVYSEGPAPAAPGDVAIQQTQAIPEAADLTSALPGPSAANVTTVDKPAIWPLIDNTNVSGPALTKPDGIVKSWDGSAPIQITLPSSLTIRALYFMEVPSEPISVMSGTQTGSAIYSDIQPTGNIAIPDGNTAVTLVAKSKFPAPISILASNNPYPPTQNESISIALASATINVSGTVNAEIVNASIPVTGTVTAYISNASIPVTGSVSATITNASLAVTGNVNANITGSVTINTNTNITNASIAVTGSVNATITNASIPITGSVTIASGSVNATISGTPNINISGQSITVEQIATSNYPNGATPFAAYAGPFEWGASLVTFADIPMTIGQKLYLQSLYMDGFEVQACTAEMSIFVPQSGIPVTTGVYSKHDGQLVFGEALQSVAATSSGMAQLQYGVDSTPIGNMTGSIIACGYVL